MNETLMLVSGWLSQSWLITAWSMSHSMIFLIFDILPNLRLSDWQSLLKWDLENLGLVLEAPWWLMKSLVWLTYLRRCLRLSKSDSWGFDKDLDNSLIGYLTSSLSCDIHSNLANAVLNSEWASLSRLSWSSLGTTGILMPFVVTLEDT